MMNAHAGDMPLVSVIMPVWQPRREWLLAAVLAALNEPNCEIELLVIDDGCPEPVGPLLASVNDPRLRVLRVDHLGPAGARNAGIAVARGRWMRFADADDMLTAGSTFHLASLAQDTDTIAYGATAVCDEHMRPESVLGSDLEGDIAVECLLARFTARLPALLVPRRVVELAGPWDPAFRVSGDWDFVLRCLEYAPARGNRDIVAYYRRNPRSVSRSATIEAGEEAWRRVITRYFDRHPNERGSRLERQAWAALYLNRGRAYGRARAYGRCLVRFARAVALDPPTGAKRIAQSLASRF